MPKPPRFTLSALPERLRAANADALAGIQDDQARPMPKPAAIHPHGQAANATPNPHADPATPPTPLFSRPRSAQESGPSLTPPPPSTCCEDGEEEEVVGKKNCGKIGRILPTTDEERLNRTEKLFLGKLRGSGEWEEVGVQSVTLKLGDDCRYTPDFHTFREGRLVFWEVKGFMREDALVKLKVAARKYRWAEFRVVRRMKGGVWEEKEVRP